jgi:hypothetical protein
LTPFGTSLRRRTGASLSKPWYARHSPRSPGGTPLASRARARHGPGAVQSSAWPIQHQERRHRLVAALQLGLAAGIEGDREGRLHQRRGDVAMAQVGRREHGAAAVRPADQADPRGSTSARSAR